MSAATKTENVPTKKKRELSKLSKTYLVLYNSVQTVGWSYVFIQSMRHLIQNWTSVGLWHKYGASVLAFQSLAALEVIHCIIGLVPSNPVLTFVQIGSRIFQAWGIIYSVPEIQNSATVGLIMFAWGLTEVVRYSFYIANLAGRSFSFLTWCRYSLFYGLYPAGVTGEVGNILQALSYIKKRQLYSIPLPNPANISFSYYYVNLFLLVSYVPLFPQLFNHMRMQRAKVLGKKEEPKELKKTS